MGKLKSLDLSNKKSLIDIQAKTISLSEQCVMIGLNRSSLYYKPKPISTSVLKIMNIIDEIYTDSSEYGYRQIHQQLTQEYGYAIGKNIVLKYMQIMGIQATFPAKRRLTSIKHPEHKIYPYLLKPYWSQQDRDTKSVYVSTPNEVWSGDITYIRTNGGFVYLAAVIDWHTKAILSYKISNSMDTTLVTDVLNEALTRYPTPKIFNSDQGSQYTSYEHTQLLKEHNIQISMNGKGRSIDNIAIERFFRTLKHENIYITDYQSIKDLKQGVSKYIDFYNFNRFHSALNYDKPMNVYLKETKRVA